MTQSNISVWGQPLPQVIGRQAAQVAPAPAPRPPAGAVPWNAGMGPQTPVAQPGAPAAAPVPGPSPYDQALAGVTAPGAGGPPHPVGLSPADQERQAAAQVGGPPHPVGLSPADQERALGLVSAAGQRERETQEQLDTERERQAAAQEHSDAVVAESKVATQGMLQRQRELDDHYQTLHTQAQDRQSRIEGEIAQQQAQGIDPNRYWHNQTTAQKIGAAFAVALGGFAAGPLGPRGSRGENHALQIIQSAISQDLDAQRADMQGHLSLLDKRMDLNREGFSRDAAMLQAERDSGMAAYTVAIKDLERRSAQYADSDRAQQASSGLIAGLQEKRDQYRDAKTDQLYALAKRSERVVGTIDRTKLLKDAAEYKKTALANGKEITQAEALRRAAEDQGIQDPNAAARTDISKPGGGVKGGLGRGLLPMAKLQGAAEAAKSIEDTVSKSTGGFLSEADKAKIETWNQEIADAGLQPVPDSFWSRGVTGSTVAAARAVRAAATLHVKNIRNGAGGGGGEAELSPEDLGAEEQ